MTIINQKDGLTPKVNFNPIPAEIRGKKQFVSPDTNKITHENFDREIKTYLNGTPGYSARTQKNELPNDQHFICATAHFHAKYSCHAESGSRF